MKIDWKQKLSSRKFWALIADFIISVMVFFGCGDNIVTQVTAIISALGGVVAYVIAEAKVDVARLNTSNNENQKNNEEV